jgi:hypothetical protein
LGALPGILGSTPNPEDEKKSRQCGEKCGLSVHSCCYVGTIAAIFIIVIVLIVFLLMGRK